MLEKLQWLLKLPYARLLIALLAVAVYLLALVANEKDNLYQQCLIENANEKEAHSEERDSMRIYYTDIITSGLKDKIHEMDSVIKQAQNALNKKEESNEK